MIGRAIRTTTSESLANSCNNCEQRNAARVHLESRRKDNSRGTCPATGLCRIPWILDGHLCTYVCTWTWGSRSIGFNTPREHNLTIGLSTDKISSTGLTRTLVIRPFKGTKVPANYKIANTYAIRLKRGSCWQNDSRSPVMHTFHCIGDCPSFLQKF